VGFKVHGSTVKLSRHFQKFVALLEISVITVHELSSKVSPEAFLETPSSGLQARHFRIS
jgi:hypothetical protein